jgi:hypothetical protein
VADQPNRLRVIGEARLGPYGDSTIRSLPAELEVALDISEDAIAGEPVHVGTCLVAGQGKFASMRQGNPPKPV